MADITLFELPQPVDLLPDRIRQMHREHGVTEGRTCGLCVHFRRRKWNKKVHFKCDIYGYSNSYGTDWRMRWPACGKWEKDSA